MCRVSTVCLIVAAVVVAGCPALCAQVVSDCSTPGTDFGTAGVPASLADTIEVTTAVAIDELEISIDLPHAGVGDLTVSITSPSGTTVTLHAGGGGVGAGLELTWSDRGAANLPPYDCICTLRPSGPGVMNDFTGELAAGTWALEIDDSVSARDGGTLLQWCVLVFRRAYAEACGTPALAFGEGTVGSPASVIDINGIGADVQMDDVEVTAEILHTAIGQVELTVTSPARTTVTLHDLAGGAADDILVTWSDLGVSNAAPFDCACFMKASGPGTFADFAGESSFGSWEFTCIDLVAGAGGTLESWCVRAFHTPDVWQCSSPGLEFDAGAGSESGISDTVAVIVDATISDIELTAQILHSAIGDVVCTITSPAGTSVTLHNLGGGLDDDLFLTWSDEGIENAAPFVCTCFMEPDGPGAMGNFGGEAADGTWTLQCDDSFPDSSGGSLESWCLRVFAGGILFRRGDGNGDGAVVPLLDAIYLLNWQFVGGPAPPCFDAADVDGNNTVSALIDALFLLQWNFLGGTPPPAPGPTICGADPDGQAADGLECETPPVPCSP